MTARDFYSCAQVVRMLDDFVDRELGAAELAAFERHLLECERCAREVRLEEGTVRAIRATLRRIQIPPEVHARVWRAVARERRAGAARLSAG